MSIAQDKQHLLACPLCRHEIQDIDDSLYPTGILWEEMDGIKSYYPKSQHNSCYSISGEVWCINCTKAEGGCGIRLEADSRDEVIALWNARQPDEPENWKKLISEYENKIGLIYLNHLGVEHRFFGLIYGSDDYYFGMVKVGTAETVLLSCVGSLEQHGYRLGEL